MSERERAEKVEAQVVYERERNLNNVLAADLEIKELKGRIKQLQDNARAVLAECGNAPDTTDPVFALCVFAPTWKADADEGWEWAKKLCRLIRLIAIAPGCREDGIVGKYAAAARARGMGKMGFTPAEPPLGDMAAIEDAAADLPDLPPIGWTPIAPHAPTAPDPRGAPTCPRCRRQCFRTSFYPDLWTCSDMGHWVGDDVVWKPAAPDAAKPEQGE